MQITERKERIDFDDVAVVPPLPRPRWRGLRKLARDRLGFFSLLMVIALIIVAIGAPLFAPADPYKVNVKQRLDGPSAEHWLGTDEMGRDLLSRIIYGTRITVGVGLAVTAGSVLIGVVVGTIAALAGGLIDEIIMRITDIFLAVPLLVLAMAITAALGPSMINAAIAMIITWWPGYARQVRAEVLTARRALYVEAARSIGMNGFRLGTRHILPNAMDSIIARMTISIGYIMLATAALSFIGLGTRPPEADWGTMIAIARAYILSFPWYPFIVGVPLFLTVFFFAMAGDAIQDMLDVRLEGG